MLNFEIYAPIHIPINWQSELITNNEQRYALLQRHLLAINGVNTKPHDWPMGYGSLEYDNLPVLYQPCAVLEIPATEAEQDISHVKLYVYDNCLAVLNLRLTVSEDIANVDDLVVSKRVEEISYKYLSPILKMIYLLIPDSPLINPRDYRFFNNDKEELTNAKPLWVARMLTQGKQCSAEYYLDWLKNVDTQTEFLKLGSGNSLITNEQHLSDVHRIMVMSQFHAALMYRIEGLQKDDLKKFNGSYYNKNELPSLDSSFTSQQYRNDHIEYINIQISAAAAGVQGIRRELLQQFNVAWGFDEQRERINQLTNLTQARIDRLVQGKLRQQNRSIQTLLAFLGSLGLISLIVDLIGVEKDVSHDDTSGLLDLIQLTPAEHLLSLTVIIVIIFTLYFYKNHE
jgi:hypothetical protein